MVAAEGAILMTASEENSSNEAGSDSTSSINQSTYPRCREVQHNAQKNNESSLKRDVATCSSNIGKKQHNFITEKNGTLISKIESKESSANVATYKTTQIRETKTSRLRAASIILPNDVTLSSKKVLGLEASNFHRHNSSVKEKSPSLSSSVAMNPIKERDKSYKRKSYLNKSRHVEAANVDYLSETESNERRSRRQSIKRNQISEMISNPANTCSNRQALSLRKKCTNSKVIDTQDGVTKSPFKISQSSNVSITSTKCSNLQSSSIKDSEVSRRVDVLTALTRATMERVERLTSATTSCTNHLNDNVQLITEKVSISPKKCNVSRHAPISILKHKVLDGEGSDRQASSGSSSHAPSPVTFSPSVIESVSRKRHGILKKRSSLDESEILRRRSCSPDVSFADNIYSEFRPILKNQRRSSLGEIVKRDQSPDQQPTSILKRKSSKEDDREIHRLSLGSPEPQSILKRKLANNMRSNNISHHVTIVSDMASANVTGNAIMNTSANLISEDLEASEVKPILKKKYSKEEFAGNDVLSIEPRPILKKKSSTESDEHEHDKPKKTILKSSRKNSYEDRVYETESTSPRKLSALKNRATEIENVRSILKQSGYNRYHNMQDVETDSFLRKRAQSVGHARSINDDNNVESIRMLTKRRSLESSSPIDVSCAPTTSRCCFTTNRSNEVSYIANGSSLIKESKLLCKETSTIEQNNTDDMEKNPSDSQIYFVKISTDTGEHNVSAQTIDQKEVLEEKGQQDTYEDYKIIVRSNSVSKITQHFKALQEKANACVENRSQRAAPQRSSHGIQRYRERKTQGSERFNTQPVTFQEVREAVLQNQRNIALNVAETLDDDPEPSKLSLAERVRLFNQKIVTAKINATTDVTCRERLTQRRRPLNRYKTQPVTSEEVEVASQISSSNIMNHQTLLGDSKECQKTLYSSFAISIPQYDLPKSILKSSVSYTQNVPHARSSELRSIKLIKSVIKRESEELEQSTIIQSPEVYPRSILKSNSHLKSIQSANVINMASRNEMSICSTESQNLNSKTINPCEKLDNFDIDTMRHNSQCLYNIEQTSISKEDSTIENGATVPLHKTTMSQNEEILLSDNVDNCRIYTVLNNASKECNNKWYDDTLMDKPKNVMNNDNNDDDNNVKKNKKKNNDIKDNKKKEKNEEKEDHQKKKKNIEIEQNDKNDNIDDDINDIENDNDDDDRASSSSGGQEVHDIILNKKHTNITQYSTNSLAKNINLGNNFLNNEKKKQQHLSLPEQCSTTQVIESIETNEIPSVSIADRLAALRHNGSTNWKRRIAGGKNNHESCNDLLFNSEENINKSSVLANCMEKLESAMESWKNRIITPDAINFTVAGKMKVTQSKDPNLPFLAEYSITNTPNQKKKIPRWFKTKKDKGYNNGAVSTPTSPCKDLSTATRISFSEPVSDDSGEEYKMEHVLSSIVSIPKTDDETFTSFFSGISLEKCENECLNLDESDFDIIAPQSKLLVHSKRNIRIHRRQAASKNPLKVLAARTDLRSEYTEVRTDITTRSITITNVGKLAKSSSFAIEALAGLASTEDFSAVTLRNVSEANVSMNKLQPYKDIMLILVKGRRHVQTRLVEPIANSINSGDNYILVTKSEVFNYVGKYSNIIEKTRAAEIASSIQQHKDLGCQAIRVITINEDKPICTKSQINKFWSYLGMSNNEKLSVIEAGHPDEDELYESAIIDTNMVYELKDKQLVPYEKFWGTIPKIEMLDKNKILVFDFGTEMYIWSGKGVLADKKRIATQLATEMWNDGYDYAECTICPINAIHMIGGRSGDDVHTNLSVKSAKSRPEWCLLAKLTQHVETILFQEKFLDWPNVDNMIKARGRKDARGIDGTATIHFDDNDDIWLPNTAPVDLVLEGCHLGRGIGYYDNELKKEYIIDTTSVMVWHIDEFSHTLLRGSSIGQFYSDDSYIVQWTYSVTITGREFSGLPSKHAAKGRDRSVHFIWQGRNASLNERGAAALLTVKLDSNRGPQIRVVQGNEPAAFLNLFFGGMVVHSGKKSEKKHGKRWRLYICQGTLKSETFLIEIPCSTRQLRSRGSFILLDTENAKVYVWHGNNSLHYIRKNAIKAASKLKENQPEEAGLLNKNNIQICEVQEGSEPEEFSNALGGINKKLYWSLETASIQNHTPKLYHLSSISKKFCATEILCPHRAELATPFPFSQDDLYQVNQPALFLLDDKNVIWIWQGWWPDSEMEDQSGSKTVRWQAERRAAMTIAIQYWRKTRSTQTTNLPIYLVWAGLEPLQFINLFPEWIYRDDVTELNIEDGRNPEEILTAEDELARLTQSTYPPAQLLQRPLPDGVDPTCLELYLSQQHFQELLGMNKEEFQQLPVWKQVNLKKELGLF